MVVASCQARGVQVADECEVETVSSKKRLQGFSLRAWGGRLDG